VQILITIIILINRISGPTVLCFLCRPYLAPGDGREANTRTHLKRPWGRASSGAEPPAGAGHGGSSRARSSLCHAPVARLCPTTGHGGCLPRPACHGSGHGLNSPRQPWSRHARTSPRRPWRALALGHLLPAGRPRGWSRGRTLSLPRWPWRQLVASGARRLPD
jgi:hypothetical protein